MRSFFVAEVSTVLELGLHDVSSVACVGHHLELLCNSVEAELVSSFDVVTSDELASAVVDCSASSTVINVASVVEDALVERGVHRSEHENGVMRVSACEKIEKPRRNSVL